MSFKLFSTKGLEGRGFELYMEPVPKRSSDSTVGPKLCSDQVLLGSKFCGIDLFMETKRLLLF